MNKWLLMLITGSFLFSSHLSAQTKYFFEIYGTYGINQNIEQLDEQNSAIPYMIDRYIVTEHFKGKPGIEINAGISKPLGKRFSLTTGMGISAVQFKRNISLDVQNQGGIPASDQYHFNDGYGYNFGNPYDYFPSVYDSVLTGDDAPRTLFDRGFNWIGNNENQDKVGQTEILYVNIPLGILYSITEKLIMAVSVKNSILTYSRQVKYGINSDYGRGVYTDTSSDGLSNYLVSGDMGLQYKISKQVWLSASYNHYFTPVYDKDLRMDEDLKYKTFRFGLKYEL